MNFKTFKKCASYMPASVSILIRGDHGIGKSQSVYQLASYFNLPMVERRLSQMSEGDMIGLPKLDDNVTKFMPPDWYMRACTEPVVLFLDELNRATPEVMQAAFQIVLDRTLNGHKLHPDTRVYAAINTNGRYQVNEMDPALLDRFWVCDLDIDYESWHAWSSEEIEIINGEKKTKRSRIHPTIRDYIKKDERRLVSGPVENGEVTQSPRSWELFDRMCTKAGNILDQDVKSSTELQQDVYSFAVGMLGLETARSFVDYVKSIDRQVSALDILNNFEANAAKIDSLGQEKWNICIDKVAEHLTKIEVTPAQAENFGKFVKSLPDELILHMWSSIADASKASETRDKNITAIKDQIVPEILRVTKPQVDAMKANLEKK